MGTTLKLSPLFRQTIGFDHFNDMFESMLGSADARVENYPPYNIEKFGEDTYKITMAVAGFGRESLDITQHGRKLKVSGNVEKVESDSEYLHRGIANRSFERTFSLADHVKVSGADYVDGLLIITLHREVPEEERPKMIEINCGNATTLDVS